MGNDALAHRGISDLKRAENTGHDIFGTNKAGILAGEAAPPAAPADDAPPTKHMSCPDDFKSIMLKDLRIMSRGLGLSPAGGKEQLVQRLLEAQAAGTIPPIMFADHGSAGMSNYVVNNHARGDGQNLGNFISERPSSRIIHAPGGGSSIDLGGLGPNVPVSGRITTPAKMREHTGNDVFNLESHPEVVKGQSESRQKQIESLQGGVMHDILATSPAPKEACRQEDLTVSMAALQTDLGGSGIFDEPTPLAPLDPATFGEARAQAHAAAQGHDVFSNNAAPQRNVIGGVRKDPGGGSSVCLGGGAFPDRPQSARVPPGGRSTFTIG
mmetsp:Transcript_5415/g.18292  ORF Transcript_5415/g.18292 Transcript_5415/m.18292 type:complete len:326 (+) Transcript_5415:369-1346(+)